MRAWLAVPLLALVAVPMMGGAADLCSTERDPAELPAPAAQLAQARALGLDLDLAQPLAPLPLSEAPDSHACSGMLRPGAQLIINGAWLCSANWVYEDEAHDYYLGTAGHCASPGDTVVAAGVGRVGEVAFSTGNGGVGNDFALIRIDPALYDRITPTMCHWGGPLAVADDNDFAIAPSWPVVHYGWGNVWGMTPFTRPRAGLTQGATWGDDSFLFDGTIAPGDSGSAIQLSTSRAAGVITHGIMAPGGGVGVVVGIATRVDHGLEQARAATGHTYQVVLSNVPVSPAGVP